MYLGHYQTMKLSFEQICQRERIWTALGNFMNDWYAYHVDERERLIIDPLPETYPQEFHRWAVFCAASVVWFCNKYGVACPDWANSPKYALPEPWFLDHPERMHLRLIATTPREFSERNIYCGGRVYANKWEAGEERAERQRRRALI